MQADETIKYMQSETIAPPKNILPDSENTCTESRPFDCSSLLESRQRDHIPLGQSRIWPVWVHPSLVHLPVSGTKEQKIILNIFIS